VAKTNGPGEWSFPRLSGIYFDVILLLSKVMPCVHGSRKWVVLVSLVAIAGLTSCSPVREAAQAAQVKKAFESCKSGLINNQMDQVMACTPSNVDDYINHLKSNDKKASADPASNSPGVDLLLKTALEKRVPDDLRPNLTFNLLMQKITEKHLLSLREVQQIDLGRVYVTGDRASGEIYYQGTLTALRMPFVRENGSWKIDILSILPYAEVLMRLDRAIKDETQQEQVDLLVSRLPSL
jgi:hypothetical protein